MFLLVNTVGRLRPMPFLSRLLKVHYPLQCCLYLHVLKDELSFFANAGANTSVIVARINNFQIFLQKAAANIAR